jgi:hypothetical protein
MQELASLIAEPLQPSFSRRFFTGRPSAAAALGFHRLAASKGAETDVGPGEGVTATGVTRNVTLAQSLTDSRQAAKSGRAGGVTKGGAKKKKGIANIGRQVGFDPEALPPVWRCVMISHLTRQVVRQKC